MVAPEVSCTRVRLIGQFDLNKAACGGIQEVQERLTTDLEDFVRRGQELGWIRRDVACRAIAVFLQAYTLGKVVDDIVATQIPSMDWNSLINKVVVDGLLEPEGSVDLHRGRRRSRKKPVG